MEETKGMKIMMPGMCPHCSKETMMTIAMTMPQLLSTHKPEEFKEAEEQVLKVLETANFESEHHKKMAMDYVKDMPFGPAEVEDMLNQVLPKEVKGEKEVKE